MKRVSQFDDHVGNILEFQKQLKIGEKLGLPTPFQVYKSWKPQNNLNLIFKIRAFAKVNKPVTVRQIYYHLVSQQLIESNIQNYNKIVRLVKRMRLAGIIPFNWITDDTRQAAKTPSWNSIEDILEAAINQYRSDWQTDQPQYVEVWLEKRSLNRIFYAITNAYDVILCVGGGYQSYDMIKDAAERMKHRAKNGQRPILLYFGDLNPSGKDMARDIKKRLQTLGVEGLLVKEIALTKQDITDHNLPQNPFKPQDTRAKWYLQKYGITYSVELDALPPDVLRKKIHTALEQHLQIDDLLQHQQRDDLDKDHATQILNQHYGDTDQ